MFSIGSFFNCVVLAILWQGMALAAPVAGLSAQTQALLERCAPDVHPETMAAVMRAESGGHQFAVADAGLKALPWSKRKAMVRSYYFGTVAEAATKARGLIAAGHTVSLGVAQLNDRQLPALGLTIEAAFEPCTNLWGGNRILAGCYERAVRQLGAGPRALRAALSCYNSGDFERGDKDGYVARVVHQVGRGLELRGGGTGAPVVPALSSAAQGPWWQSIGVRGGGRGREFTMSARDFAHVAE